MVRGLGTSHSTVCTTCSTAATVVASTEKKPVDVRRNTIYLLDDFS